MRRTGFIHPLIVLSVLLLAVPAIAADNPYDEVTDEDSDTFEEGREVSEQRYFLRRDDCGGDADNTHLSITAGSEESDGCALIFNPANEVLIQAEFDALSTEYPSADGGPFTLATVQEASGELVIGNWAIAGGGLAQVDLTLTGTPTNTPPFRVSLGETTEEYIAEPIGTTTVDYAFDLPEEHHGLELDSVRLEVVIRGVTAHHSAINHNGASFLDVPFIVDEDEGNGDG